MKFRGLISFEPGLHRGRADVAVVEASSAGDAYQVIRELYTPLDPTDKRVPIVWGVVEVLS